MKPLLLILLVAAGLVTQAQETPLFDSEKVTLRTNWRQHWSEMVKAEIVNMKSGYATVRITNGLPYNISKYSISLKWYDAGDRLILKPYKDGGKMIYPPSALKGYMRANTTQISIAPMVPPGAVSLKVSVAYVELPKIGMKQDSL